MRGSDSVSTRTTKSVAWRAHGAVPQDMSDTVLGTYLPYLACAEDSDYTRKFSAAMSDLSF